MTIQDDTYNEEYGEDALRDIFNALVVLKQNKEHWADAKDERVQYLEVVDRFFGWVESMQYEGLEMWDLDWKSIKEELL